MAAWGTSTYATSQQPPWQRGQVQYNHYESGEQPYAGPPWHGQQHLLSQYTNYDHSDPYAYPHSQQNTFYVTDPQQEEQNIDGFGDGHNMAGFGARRFAEMARKKAEAAEVQRLRHEEAVRARQCWEAQQRQQAAHEDKREQRKQPQHQRQQPHEEESVRQHLRFEEQQSLRRWDQQEEKEGTRHYERNRQVAQEQQRPANQSENVFTSQYSAEQWYLDSKSKGFGDEPSPLMRSRSSPPSRASGFTLKSTPPIEFLKLPVSSEGLQSSRSKSHSPTYSLDSSSCGRLSYESSPLLKNLAFKAVEGSIQAGSSASGGTTSASLDRLTIPAGSSVDTQRLSLVDDRQHRATIYEDEFEEGNQEHDEIAANLSRYTHYGEYADEGLGESMWSGARKSLFQGTTDQPLPKAKCADCGEEFEFEELGQHACNQASQPDTPTLPLTPLSCINREPNKSPFFDKYDRLHGERPGRLGTSPSPTSLCSPHDSNANISRKTIRDVVGLGFSQEMSPAQSDFPSSLQDKAAQSVAERRRWIEAQREAKRQESGSSPVELGDGIQTTGRSLSTAPHGELNAIDTSSGARRNLPQRNVSPSSSFSQSSSSTDVSSLLNSTPSPVSVTITPSSSCDRFSERDGPSSTTKGIRDEGPRKDLLSPPSVNMSWALARSSSDMANSSSAASVTETGKQRLAQLAAASPSSASTGFAQIASKSRTRRGPPKEFDLGGIEDLMHDLQVGVDRSVRSPVAKASSSPSSTQAMRRGAKSVRPVRLCCVCMCSLSSRETPCVEQNGNLFCAEDYKQLFLPKCSKCRLPVEKNAVRSSDGALKGIFHRSCFCCFQCNAKFADGIFYVMDNTPYCFEHYSLLAGTQCASCGLGIEGMCRQTEATGERFHPHCLTCQYEDARTGKFCHDLLDEFYVIHGRRLCEHHANIVQVLLDKITAEEDRSRGHSDSHHRHEHRAEKRRTMLRALQ